VSLSNAEEPMERRFHSPYKRWVAGLITEVSVLIGFVVVMALVAVLVVWLAG
jgi:hypothetical protein